MCCNALLTAAVVRPRLLLATVVLLVSACDGTHSQLAPMLAQPTPQPTAIPATFYVVSGTVLAGGIPVADALVDLVGTGQPGGYTFTGGDGSFRIVGAPKGSVALRAGKKGFKTQILTIIVDSNVSHNVTLQAADLLQPLAVGTPVVSVVKQDDSMCATSDPGIEEGDAGRGLVGPCKTFLVTISEDGTLVATATWTNKDMPMTVLTPLRGICCWSPLALHVAVTAGSTIELSVSIHASDMLPPETTASFELVTRLEPSAPTR